MRRIFFGLAFATALSGCHQEKEIPVNPVPKLESEVTAEHVEELRYLHSLSNPTRQQWDRMRGMDKSPVGEKLKTEDSAAEFRRN